jgi:hypothetical protein
MRRSSTTAFKLKSWFGDAAELRIVVRAGLTAHGTLLADSINFHETIQSNKSSSNIPATRPPPIPITMAMPPPIPLFCGLWCCTGAP